MAWDLISTTYDGCAHGGVNVKMSLFFLTMTMMISFQTGATESQPLLFQAWKNQQILEAQNQVLRSSAKISMLKTTKSASSASAQLPTTRVKSSDPLISAEKDLRRAQESLTNAQNLAFEDYVTIYIPTLHDQPETVARLAEKLSHDELVDVVKFLVRQAPRLDAKRNATLLGSLGPAPGSRAN
jgi:hypothetical protein